MITQQERDRVYIYDEIGAREILADLIEEFFPMINEKREFIGIKVKYTLKNIHFYPAGELLCSILSIDTKSIKTIIKNSLELDEDIKVEMPFPFNIFDDFFYYGENIIRTINCISAAKEFADLLETNRRINVQIWIRALWDFLDAWDYVPEYNTQIEIADIYEGCTWEKTKYRDSYETSLDETSEDIDVTDIFSLDFDASCLKQYLPGYTDFYEHEENFLNEFPNFSLRINCPEHLLFASLEQCYTHDILIKKCKNCGKYFVPQNRSDTLYCDRKAPQDESKTCKEYGARQAWKTALKENETAGLYRKIYMSKQMLAKRNPTIKDYSASFEKFKTESKKWKSDVKSGVKSEADYLEWLKAVKEKKVL